MNPLTYNITSDAKIPKYEQLKFTINDFEHQNFSIFQVVYSFDDEIIYTFIPYGIKVMIFNRCSVISQPTHTKNLEWSLPKVSPRFIWSKFKVNLERFSADPLICFL